jgi:hypothetical protein
MSQATTATSHQPIPLVQRLANPSVQQLANAQYESDEEDW